MEEGIAEGMGARASCAWNRGSSPRMMGGRRLVVQWPAGRRERRHEEEQTSGCARRWLPIWTIGEASRSRVNRFVAQKAAC